MKHLSFVLQDKKAYKNAQKHFQKKRYNAALIQLFCGISKPKKIRKILQELAKDFPGAVIIGATTAGEIANAKMYDNSVVVSLSLFEHTKLKAKYSPNIDKQSAQESAQELCSKHTKAMVVLCEGLWESKYEEYLSGINAVAPDVIVSGGLAGDNFALKQTFVFFGQKVYDKGLVSVSFSSKKLYASNHYNLNWTPIGKEFCITKVQGNIVKEIDSLPAVKFFEKYLGEEVLNNKALLLPNFQLLFQEGATTVARTPMAIEGESLVFAGHIHEGQKVQFGFSNKAAVIDGAHEIYKDMVHHPAEGIYIFSCIARKTLLGNILEQELNVFEEVAPTAGFFTYGEFYSADNKEVLLNCTTTLLILSESTKVQKHTLHQKSQKTLDNTTFNALVHFIEQTSAELKQNARLMNQYKEAVDASLLVSKTDTRGYITYVNENFCTVSKYTKKELLGQNHNIVRDPATSAFVFKKLWQTIKAGKIWRGIFSNKAKDGSIYHVQATIMPIFNEQGDIEEYIAIRQDITKQIQAKERMATKEKLIRAIFDNQDSIVIHASKTHGMQGVNKKLFEYFDYKNFEDFKSKNKCICDLFLDEEGYVHPSRQPNWLDDLASDDTTDYKVKMRAKTGKVHTFTIKVKKIADEYIINLYDITKLEQALLKAYSSERAKATFLANMSHEIRTPLNGILGFTDLLLKKQLDKDTSRYVDIIHKSGQTLLNVVNDILDFSKLESGELSLYITESNLFEEMEAAVSTFASVAHKKKINYYTYIDTNIPKALKCDVQRIKQVMNNLISNAIKFTPEEGEVRVTIECKALHEEKASLHFSVKDSGIGIAKEKIATIFQAFSQADNSISREFGGTGLGLAISNQYINMMGSHIEVQSEEGKGSEFFFTLELEVIDATPSMGSFKPVDTIHLGVLNSSEGIRCGINEIVYTYLDAWNFEYQEYNDLDDVNQNTDILIVCAKLFEQQRCEKLLETYPQLKIIYIEGSETFASCHHERFYLVKQPMTGSALFDKLIELMDGSVLSEDSQQQEQLPKQQYKGKVLIAEDNETNQMLISIMLKERGIEFTIVSNGQEALETLLQHPTEYALVFMDINMPILDGVEATKRLRQEGYDSPIVSLSANVIESDTESFKAAGMNDTLNKPIVPKELDAILTKYLQGQKEQTLVNVEEYDTINVTELEDILMLQAPVVKKLFASLGNSFAEIAQELEAGNIDEALLHKLKGAAGNMRITKLYQLTKQYEEAFASMDDKQKQHAMQTLLKHLYHVIEEINNL